MPRSPCTLTQDHPIASPIWECSISAVEAFFADEPEEGGILHACIERESWTGKKWRSKDDQGSSGATQKCSVFTTKDIERMIDNIPSASVTSRVSRVLTRHDTSHKIDKVTVCSVRVWYNDAAMFVDRDESDWHSWRRGDFLLSTGEIKSMLKYVGHCDWRA